MWRRVCRIPALEPDEGRVYGLGDVGGQGNIQGEESAPASAGSNEAHRDCPDYRPSVRVGWSRRGSPLGVGGQRLLGPRGDRR